MKMSVCAAAAILVGAGSVFAQVRITEWAYSAAPGEFIELTNIGNDAVDLTGWSYDDDSATPGVFDLSGFGVVGAGESVVLTEASADDFRAAWSLPASVGVLGGVTNNLGRNDQINIFGAGGELIDRLTFGDQFFPGTIRTQDRSGWAFVSGPGPFGNVNADWVLSQVGDAQGSYAAGTGAIGSPGVYVPAPGAGVLALTGLALLRRRR